MDEEKQTPKYKHRTTIKELKTKMEMMEADLKKLNDEKADLIDTLQRVQAEFENYRKRMLKEQTRIIDNASMLLIKKMLPVMDDFERAVASLKNESGETDSAKGIELINKKLLDIMEKEGLKEIYPYGETFDPNFHEAVMQIPSEEHEDNTVIEVLQKGYMINDNLLRPAMVKVSKK